MDPADDDAGTFVKDQPLKATHEADGLDFGTRVDRYVVHDLIGRGGMGLVYTAHDPDLDRWVAIKLLRTAPNSADASSIGQARLLREAQAMAQLSHPNVMPVYDVGKYQQSVFVAMELVRGFTLDKWVKAKPRSLREVLAMFIAAGRGLEAAHSAGLVHRDFKPANVLIGEDGRPRVTDFGIARSVRQQDPAVPLNPSETPTRSAYEKLVPETTPSSLDAPLTRDGALMGSPGYMAPEQYAGLPTSPATDQFAFCVALYEALYGARPFQGQSFAELAHSTTLGKVPPAPKGTQVPVWLHRILERGLAAEDTKRHASMTALLHALTDDPDEKLKRRLAIGGIAAIGVALAATVGWSQYQQRRACRGAEALLVGVWDDPARAAGKKAFDATQKSYAPLAWDHAKSEMDTYAREWTKARTEACEATRLRGEQSDEVMLARMRCLDRRRDELNGLAQAYAAADIDTVDRAYGAASHLSPISTCARVRAGSAQLSDDAQRAIEQLSHQLAQGRSLTSAGKFDLARERLFSALQISRALKLPAQQGECELALGELEREANRFPQAGEALQKAVRYAEAAGDDETAARALTVMVSLTGWRLEHPDEGRALADIATGKLERMGGDVLIDAALAEGLGDTEWQGGNRAASLLAYERSLKLFEAAQGKDSLDVARLHSAIGWVLTEQGELGKAQLELTASRQIREKAVGTEHPSLIGGWNELGALAAAMGDGPEAVRCMEQALKLSKNAYGNDSVGTMRMALNLAEQLANDGRAGEGPELIEFAKQVLDHHPDAPNSHKAQLIRTEALVELMRGHLVEAEARSREAMDLVEKTYGTFHPEVALNSHDLGLALAAQSKWAEALVAFDRYLATQEKLGAKNDPEVPMVLAESGRALVQLKRDAEGFERLEKALEMLPLDGGNHRRAAAVRFVFAQTLPASEKARAKKLALEARTELELAKRPEEMKRIDAWLTTH